MRYIVSGHRRTGTSVMMQALANGQTDGTRIFAARDRTLGNIERDGYRPIPGLFLEVGQNYKNAEWLRKMPDNIFVKIFFDGLPNLPLGKYKIIFMVRDEWEINHSVERAEKHIRSFGVPPNPPSDSTFYVYRPYSQADVNHVLGICEARSDIDLIKVNFTDLIKHPKHEFETLRLRGVPIDPDKAASVIDPSYYRSKK